jgi:hypothetical protein
LVGFFVGFGLAFLVGFFVGIAVAFLVGFFVGFVVAFLVGFFVGAGVAFLVGTGEGCGARLGDGAAPASVEAGRATAVRAVWQYSWAADGMVRAATNATRLSTTSTSTGTVSPRPHDQSFTPKPPRRDTSG